MKIIYLLKSFAAKGGEERVMADKMNYLAEHGYEITLLTYEQGEHKLSYPLHPTIKHYDLRTRFFVITNESLGKKVYHLIALRKKFINRLCSKIMEVRADLLISTIVPLKNISLLINVKKKTGIRIWLESHLAFKATIRATDFNKNSFKYYIAKLYDRWNLQAVQHCDCLIALTNGDAENWKKYSHQVIVIPNPITHIPHELSLPKSPHRIIAVGRLHAQKGFDLLIQAFSLIANSIPDWYIDIYGHGIEEQHLKELIHSKNLGNRIFLKGVTDHIFEEYQKSQFFVLSSRYEGWGLVLLEAMACGIPCVSFRCDYGPEDIIKDKVDGILVEDGNIQEMADKILWTATHPKERNEMGKVARKKAQLYNKETIMSLWVKMLDNTNNQTYNNN